MKKMLNKSTINRLCKLSHIKSDPWFLSFSWENLLSLSLPPPFLPKVGPSETKSGTIPFLTYARNIKEYIPSKVVQIDPKTQGEYDEWFKNF